jgi:hypothetical protein
MIELTMRVKAEGETNKISVELIPNNKGANIVEEDVLNGLFPHITNLLNGLLGGEGFRKNEDAIDVGESKILDTKCRPQNIPMTEEYLTEKGLVEPLDGPELRDGNEPSVIL